MTEPVVKDRAGNEMTREQAIELIVTADRKRFRNPENTEVLSNAAKSVIASDPFRKIEGDVTAVLQAERDFGALKNKFAPEIADSVSKGLRNAAEHLVSQKENVLNEAVAQLGLNRVNALQVIRAVNGSNPANARYVYVGGENGFSGHGLPATQPAPSSSDIAQRR